jgi:hypothetical protein
MKKFKQVLSLALASVMTLGMLTTSVSVSAVGVDNPCTEIEVSKTVKVENKGTLLPTEEFHITMVPASATDLVKEVDGKEVAATDANGQKVEVGPKLKNDTLTFSFDAGDSTSSGAVEKKDAFKLLFTTDFDHTGVYRYYVTETEATDENGKEVKNGYIDYDTTKYVVDLYIDQNSTGKYVVSNYCITIEGKDTKPPKISFENEVYCSNLKIFKEVKGTEYQQGEFYTFRILIPIGGTTIELKEGQKLQAQICNTNGVVIDVENGRTDAKGKVELTVAGDNINADMGKFANTFKLKNGEWLEIVGAPVTMVYKVEEVIDSEQFKKEGYTVTYNYKEYGANDTTTKSDVKDQSGNVVQGTINTVSNEVTFVNTRNIEIPNSGISMDFLPYLLVMLVALCGSILLMFMRKRSTH